MICITRGVGWLFLVGCLFFVFPLACDTNTASEPTQEPTSTQEPPTSTDTSQTEPQTPEPSPDAGAPEAGPEPQPEPSVEKAPVSCPQPGFAKVGTKLGDYLKDVTLYDCDGKALKLSSLCGKALWISFHHGWCPHCQKLNREIEGISSRYANRGLTSIALLVQTSSRTAPDPQSCKDWRQLGNHKQVLTLYDPTFVTRQFWEQNYTALNIFVDKGWIINSKFHSDREADLTQAIEKALGPTKP